MTNPGEILSNFVAKLRAIEDLVDAMGGDATRIRTYVDRYPASNSLALAIYEMQSPGMMVAYMGTELAPFGQGETNRHYFSIFVRMGVENASDPPLGYYDIARLLVDGVPTLDPRRMEELIVHENCYEMRREGRFERRTDHEQVDYFEMPVSFGERCFGS